MNIVVKKREIAREDKYKRKKIYKLLYSSGHPQYIVNFLN